MPYRIIRCTTARFNHLRTRRTIRVKHELLHACNRSVRAPYVTYINTDTLKRRSLIFFYCFHRKNQFTRRCRVEHRVPAVIVTSNRKQ